MNVCLFPFPPDSILSPLHQFVAAVSRCPCISLLLVYGIALLLSIILWCVAFSRQPSTPKPQTLAPEREREPQNPAEACPPRRHGVLAPRPTAISAPCHASSQRHMRSTSSIAGAGVPQPCNSLARCSVSSMTLASAAKDDGFAAIVSQVAQYELNDVRSMKQDSFEVSCDECLCVKCFECCTCAVRVVSRQSRAPAAAHSVPADASTACRRTL